MNHVSLQKDSSIQTIYQLSGIVSYLGESIETGSEVHLYLTYIQRTLDTYSTGGETGHAIKVMGCNYISNIAGWFTLQDSRVTRTAETAVLRAREETADILIISSGYTLTFNG